MAVEIINDFKIYYKYVFYKLDLANVGNEFRIVIPVETELDIVISRPNILIRTFTSREINYSTDKFELDNNIENEIIQIFKKFDNFKIRLTTIQVNSDPQIKSNTNILELTTKQLPQQIEHIEELRELSIKILNELIMKKNTKRPAINY